MIPTIAEIFEQGDNLELAYQNEQLNLLLNQNPNEKWVKTHPFIKNYKYLPIDKVEFLLKKIFKQYKIEILREGTAFNGVYVVTRVHYLNPVTGLFDFHDGIGACQLQTAKGTSASDLININNGAISMAFPIAKTIAVKDACDHFGRLFGADLNRNDLIPFQIDNNIVDRVSNRVVKLIESKKTIDDLEQLLVENPTIDKNLIEEKIKKIKENEI